jgi:hypothetical protein
VKFRPFIELEVAHPYYTDGRCPDFSIEPTPETGRRLNNYRCILKPFLNGVRILTEVTAEGSQFIPWPQEQALTFRLRLQNPDFALFTDLAEISQAAAPLYSNAALNAGKPAQLALTSRRAWATEPFVVSQPGQAEPFIVRGRPVAGQPLSAFTIEGLGQVAQPASYDPTTRVIAVNTRTAHPGDAFKISYETAPPRARGVFAEVEIQLNNTMPDLAAGPGQFQVAFSAKKARWKYYLITDRVDTRFQIEDKGAEPLAFSDKNRTDLNQQPDPADEIAQALAEQYPHMQRWRFVSDEPVPCRQQARKSIQLRLNGQPLFEALPNPSPRNYAQSRSQTDPSASLRTGFGNEIREEEALFQVVKYFTQQYQTTGG